MDYPISLPKRGREPALFWSTFWDGEHLLGDWRVAPAADPVNPGGLDATGQLASAVYNSLFTDRQAPEGWRPEIEDRRGWWGDGVQPEGEDLDPLGSHLWLLKNEVASEENAELARLYAQEALAWLVTEKVAASVTVESGLIEDPRRGIWLAIRITDRQGEIAFDRRFARLWREI